MPAAAVSIGERTKGLRVVAYWDTEWIKVGESGGDLEEGLDWLEWIGLAVTSALLAGLIAAVAVVIGA